LGTKDITAEVEEAFRESGIEYGICILSTCHTTAGIIVNESESGLRG